MPPQWLIQPRWRYCLTPSPLTLMPSAKAAQSARGGKPAGFGQNPGLPLSARDSTK